MALCSDVSGAAICLPVCACCTGAEGLRSKCRQADTPQQSHPVTVDVMGRGKGERSEERKHIASFVYGYKQVPVNIHIWMKTLKMDS